LQHTSSEISVGYTGRFLGLLLFRYLPNLAISGRGAHNIIVRSMNIDDQRPSSHFGKSQTATHYPVHFMYMYTDFALGHCNDC